MRSRVGRSALLILLPALALAACGGALGAAAPTQPKTAPTQGCERATSVVVPDDRKPSSNGGRGPSVKAPLAGLAVASTDAMVLSSGITPLDPRSAPPSMSLRLSLLAPWVNGGPTNDTRFMQVFAANSVEGFSIWEILDAGGWILYEGPLLGRDASSVKAMLDAVGNGGRSAQVTVGSFDALIVHGDARGEGPPRAYGLYWSDGSRDMSIQAVADSAEVIDFARSLYCTP